MTLGEILSSYTYTFLLIFIRYTGLFIVTPIFSSRTIPLRIKVGLSFMMAITTIPLFTGGIIMPSHEGLILITILREILIGFSIGFIALISFAVIQLAGRFIDMRMGFAIVNVADPIHGETLPLIGQFKNLLAILLFLAINGHHVLIKALFHSFDLIPPGGANLTTAGLEFIIKNSGELFILAFRVALPVIGTLFIADMILGFLARTMPQLNIFVVGLPLKILVGMVMLFLSLNIFMGFVGNTFTEMFEDIYKLLSLLQ